jgi:hypothetical protein
MSRRGIASRRGSALVLVLLMTLAVAALAIAAIFMTSSAGLLSRFYDKERLYRLAAESALELTRSRLTNDVDLAIPDTGMIQLLSGWTPTDAGGGAVSGVSVNVYAAVTGDTTGAFLPYATLIAAAYDASGTRHVRRMDLERESFSRYQIFTDTFATSLTFGPATVAGRVHSNQTWRSGSSAATAGVYLDSITTVSGFTGTATYLGDSASGVPPVPYPDDSTYSWMTTLASTANLSFAPVAGSGAGWVRGSRLEFVAFDADGDGTIELGEGFGRVFDLAAGQDTSRIRPSLDASSWYIFFYAKPWSDAVVQNQCGAFYYRDSRWQFFPISTHRAAWARNVIQQTGAGNVPAVTNGTMNTMDDYSSSAATAVLNQMTARCLPAGSPYLMTSERMTNDVGVVTGTVADTVPFGVVTPPGGWPLASPNGYGGMDTTFTPRSLTCSISTGGTTGRCDAGTWDTLGTWRSYGGTAVSGISSTIRQANELGYLWPLGGTYNSASRGVMRSTSGPLFLSGLLRGRLTLVVDGSVVLIDHLKQVNNPAIDTTTACADQLGIVAVGDILVADNAATRHRRIWWSGFSSLTKHFGPSKDFVVHAQLMSLTGTVGTENPSVATVSSTPLSCPQDAGGNVAAGCLRLVGGMAMQNYSTLWTASQTGMRFDGVPDRCQSTSRRPPFFPLTNRYTELRNIEVEASEANNPTKIRALLMRLKGKR